MSFFRLKKAEAGALSFAGSKGAPEPDWVEPPVMEVANDRQQGVPGAGMPPPVGGPSDHEDRGWESL